MKDNQFKTAMLFGVPLLNIWAPTAEELVFRGILLLCVSSLTVSCAWPAIIICATLFGLMHWFGKKVDALEIFNEAKRGESMKEASERLVKDDPHQNTKKAIQVCLTFVLGLVTSYLAVKYQSLWLAVGIHFVWNLLAPIVLMLLFCVVLLIVVVFGALWNLVRKTS